MGSFPKIGFSGLELSKAGTEEWVSARAKVMEALQTFGFFTAEFDEVSGELLDEIFGPVAKSLFGVPSEVKQQLVSDKPFQGYVGKRPGFNYESFNLKDPPHTFPAFADQIWPHGNPQLRDTLWSFIKKASELELMVKKMILEGLGVAEHFSSFVDSSMHGFNIAEYGPPADQDTMIAMSAHKDMNVMNILYQRQTRGLEVLTKTGEWLLAPPNSITVMTGDSFEVWSNGRIKAGLHRVRLTSNETRYSVGFGSQFRDGYIVEAPRKMVSDEHPNLFKTFEFISYMLFRFSEEGIKANDPLRAYCGANINDDDDEVRA